MSDLEDWELSDDEEPIVANLDAVDSLIEKKKKDKEEEEAAKNKGKTPSTLVVPTESEFLEKFNALEDQQKASFYKLLTVGSSSSITPAFSNASNATQEEDEEDRLERIRQENERIANMSESERKAYERQKQEDSDLAAAMSTFGVGVKDLPVSTSAPVAPKKVAKKKDPLAAVEKLEIKNMPEATRLAEIVANKLKILNKPNYVNAFLSPILDCVYDVLSGDDLADYGLQIGKRAKEKKTAERQDFKKQQELKKKEEKQKKEKFKQNNDLFGGDDDFLDETPSYGSASNSKKYSKYDEDYSMF